MIDVHVHETNKFQAKANNEQQNYKQNNMGRMSTDTRVRVACLWRAGFSVF